MAVAAKWGTPGTVGSNIASTTLNSLGIGAASAFITFDNSTALDMQGDVELILGSFTPAATVPLVRLHLFSVQASTVPDNTALLGGGEVYVQPCTTGASVKNLVFPAVLFRPRSMRICIVNLTGTAFASSGNSLKFGPYNESGV
jgi:hypothetical protein